MKAKMEDTSDLFKQNLKCLDLLELDKDRIKIFRHFQ